MIIGKNINNKFFKFQVGIFRDKKDLEITLTNDNIINVTGMMGSGKTTLAREIKKQKNIELISLDWMFGASIKNRPEYIANMLKSFEKIYPETKGQEIFKYYNIRRKNKKVDLKYYEYADKIYNYLLENIQKPVIIEGRHIYRYIDHSLLKGKIIIKRTSLVNSYKRAFKRDMRNKIKEYKNNEIKINKVFSRAFERIKIPINDYIIVNKYISKVIDLYSKLED